MLNITDYEKDFQILGITKEEGEKLISYLSELAEIGISCLENKELEEKEYE